MAREVFACFFFSGNLAVTAFHSCYGSFSLNHLEGVWFSIGMIMKLQAVCPRSLWQPSEIPPAGYFFFPTRVCQHQQVLGMRASFLCRLLLDNSLASSFPPATFFQDRSRRLCFLAWDLIPIPVLFLQKDPGSSPDAQNDKDSKDTVKPRASEHPIVKGK